MVKFLQSDLNQNLRQEVLNIAGCIYSLQIILDELISKKEASADFQNLFDTYQNLQYKVNFLEKNLMIFEQSFNSENHLSNAA